MSGAADLCARRHKNIYIEREKRDDERRHALGTSVGVSFFERKIASDNVSLVFQSLTQSSVAHLGPASTNRDIANLRIAGRCARAGSGHTTMPRRTVMSSRREPLVSLAAGSSLLRYGNAAGGEEDRRLAAQVLG